MPRMSDERLAQFTSVMNTVKAVEAGGMFITNFNGHPNVNHRETRELLSALITERRMVEWLAKWLAPFMPPSDEYLPLFPPEFAPSYSEKWTNAWLKAAEEAVK